MGAELDRGDVLRAYQHLCGQCQGRLRQAASVHNGDGSSPIAVTVKQASNWAPIHDPRKGLVGFRDVYARLQAAVDPVTLQLQTLFVLRAWKRIAGERRAAWKDRCSGIYGGRTVRCWKKETTRPLYPAPVIQV